VTLTLFAIVPEITFTWCSDAAKAQGWAPWVLDTNGNGKVDEYTEPG
jgi:hypothetical protein